LQFK
jgi:hypothetical protein